MEGSSTTCRQVSDGADGPADVVCSQDQYYVDGVVDADGWARTVFLPYTLISTRGSRVIADLEALAAHFATVRAASLARGIFGIRTRIASETLVSETSAVVTGYRDHLDDQGNATSSAGQTWSLIQTPVGWRIVLAHFNDMRRDPSIVSAVIRDDEAGA